MILKHKPYRISLFAKFAMVIFLSGIVPIILLSTVMQKRMLTEYRASLLATYKEAISYSAYSIRAKLDTYNDLSKLCYAYNYSNAGDFASDYAKYDNLRQILTGEAFADSSDKAADIRNAMEIFLHYLNTSDANIEATHFVYAPQETMPIAYHRASDGKPSFNDAEFYETMQYQQLDKTTRNLIMIPAHSSNYIHFPVVSRKHLVTVARNYYDLTKPVGKETYVGTLFIDLRLDAFSEVFSALRLAGDATVSVADLTGKCYYSSEESLIEQTLDLSIKASAEAMLLSQDIPEYGLTVWFNQSNLPIEAQIRGIRNAMYLVILLSLAALLCGAMLFSRKLTQPLRIIMRQMGEVEAGNFKGLIPVVSNDELGDLTERFNHMSAELDVYTKQVYLSKIKQTEAELNALKSQIYPHFLYNTLEVIRMTAIGRQDHMVADMVEALSDQIRYVIGTISDLVPLRLEVDILTKYVYLLNCRFDNKVSFSYNCNGLADVLIPKLILQPIVENAFIHGIKPLQGPGHVQLTVEKLTGSLVLTVMDNGVGMPQEAVKKLQALLDSDQPGQKKAYEWGSIGLKNVHDRVRYLYGQAYGVSLFSTPGVGTAVKVTIPENLQNPAPKEDAYYAENVDCR